MANKRLIAALIVSALMIAGAVRYAQWKNNTVTGLSLTPAARQVMPA